MARIYELFSQFLKKDYLILTHNHDTIQSCPSDSMQQNQIYDSHLHGLLLGGLLDVPAP